jgi:hypothetical protein
VTQDSFRRAKRFLDQLLEGSAQAMVHISRHA